MAQSSFEWSIKSFVYNNLLECAPGIRRSCCLRSVRTLGAGGMFSMAGEREAPIIELENGGNGEEPRQGANE